MDAQARDGKRLKGRERVEARLSVLVGRQAAARRKA
jgi:hypothetical protein